MAKVLIEVQPFHIVEDRDGKKLISILFKLGEGVDRILHIPLGDVAILEVNHLTVDVTTKTND
jgi:hypothetical protein